MAEPQEHFNLPREDWYDEKGRIYKDALIENFNAIEKKLLELARLTAFITEAPDISGIIFPDVNLETSEDNQIINLKSFLEIMNLINFPTELTFSDKTCTKISYWSDEYRYVTITNKKVNCSKDLPYVYFNFRTKEFITSNSETTPEDCKFIAYYADNKIINLYSDNYANINVLYYLAKMSIETYAKTYSSGTREDADRDRGRVVNNRWVGGANTNTRTSGSNSVIYKDIGRRSS